MNFKHGWHKKKLYKVWSHIKLRCNYKKMHNYHYYGGRGISVCEDWTESFIKFKDWALKNGYREGLQIDRIDNNGNYEPLNCRFVEPKINSRNRRNNKLTEEKAGDIRREYSLGLITQRKLAEKYNINQSLVSVIVNKKVWI